MQPPKQYTAKLEEKIEFNSKYTQYDFELLEPNVMEFLAGQYVSVKVSEAGERRSYSICSSPAVQHGFQLLVDLEPQGVGAKFLQNLTFGDSINFLGPLGRFVLQDDFSLLPGKLPETVLPEEAIVLIATGSGIAPFRSMVLELLQERKDTRPIILHWGMRHAEQLFWEDEFAELMEAFPNFKFHPVVSQPIAGWSLCSGRVTDCLQVHAQPKNAGYYLCGNETMVQEVSQVLTTQGVQLENIHHEKFY
jgi:NAD(P)H-flavin reductase